MPRRAQTAAGRLLRVLLVRNEPLPANPGKRQAKWVLLLTLFCLTTAGHGFVGVVSENEK